MQTPPTRRSTALPLLAVWATCTLVNLGKAAHIDDTAHLEIAQWILRDPLHPMQGVVQWSDLPAKIHTLNQPHLFFYLLAGAGALGSLLFGEQLVVSAFVAAGIAAFHALYREVVGERGATLATALLFLGPAFVPGQNVMTDAPLLTLWLLFGLAIVRARGASSARWLAAAGVFAGLACLVKYTSLVLLPLLALDLALRGRAGARLAPVLAIPALFLAAWAGFNLADYGGIHMLERPLEVGQFSALEAFGITLGRGALWLITLGALLPFSLVFAPELASRKRLVGGVALGLLALTVATQVVAAVGPAELRGEPVLHSAARGLFLVVGVVAFGSALRGPVPHARGSDAWRAALFLRAWLAAGAVFVVVLSPFVAVRHVLLVLPPLMLLITQPRLEALAQPARRPWIVVASALTIALGVLLGISDRRWAESYRAAATRHAEHTAGMTYFVGHWGWQWHARSAGMVPYVPGGSPLVEGDVLVRPSLVDQPRLDESDAARLTTIGEDAVAAGPLDWLRTTTPRLGYYAVWQGLPYTVSFEPVEVFEISRVTAPPPPR